LFVFKHPLSHAFGVMERNAPYFSLFPSFYIKKKAPRRIEVLCKISNQHYL
jgi:hypothetical protein